MTFGAALAAGLGGGLSVGFAAGCDGSKVRFTPMWSWQAGMTSNVEIGAGIEVRLMTTDGM